MSQSDQWLDRPQDSHRSRESGWMSKCPVQRNVPTCLSIRDLPAGRILIRRFVGYSCGDLDVVEAVGLDLHDLYRKRWNGFRAGDLVVMGEHEATVAARLVDHAFAHPSIAGEALRLAQTAHARPTAQTSSQVR